VSGDFKVFEAEPGELIACPRRQIAIAFGSRHVRLAGEYAVLVANAIRRRQREEATFDVGFPYGVGAGEAKGRAHWTLPCRDEDESGDR